MRFLRPVLGLLLVAGCASGPSAAPPGRQPAPEPSDAGAGAPRPEPGRDVSIRYPRNGAGLVRYAFSRYDSVAATMPSGESQVQTLASTAYLTIAWIAADSGTNITATADSIVADSGLTLPMAVLDSARGSRWTALRPPGGGLSGLSASKTSLLGDQIRDQLALLFPRLPGDGAHPNGHWEDSAQAPTRVSAFEASETSHFSAAAGAVDGGTLPIQVLVIRSASGEATQFGQAITLKATGSDTLTYRLTTDGRVLEVGGQRRTSLVVELSSIGQTVPVTEVSHLRMTLIR